MVGGSAGGVVGHWVVMAEGVSGSSVLAGGRCSTSEGSQGISSLGRGMGAWRGVGILAWVMEGVVGVGVGLAVGPGGRLSPGGEQE